MSYRSNNSSKNGPYINTGQMSPNKYQQSPTNSSSGMGNYSPPFQNSRVNQGNYQGMNQGVASPSMTGINPAINQGKVKYLPFQPPRISSHGKYYPGNHGSPSTNMMNSQSQSPVMMNNNDNRALEIEISKLQEKLKEAVKINNMATIQINKLKEKVADYDELKINYKAIKKENNELHEKMESQQINFTNKNALIEQKLEESKENLMSLLGVKLELDQSKKNVESLKHALVKSSEKMKDLQENLNQVQQEKEVKEKEIEQLKEEIKNREENLEGQIQQQSNEKEQEINFYKQEIEEYKNEIQDYVSKIKEYEGTIKEQEDQIEVYKLSEGDLTNLKKEFDENMAQFEIKDKSIEEKTKQLCECIAENEYLKKIISEKEKEAVESDYLKGVLDKKESEINDMIKKNEELDSVNKELMKTLEEEKKKTQEKVESLEKQNEELKRENDEHNKAIESCRSDAEKNLKEMENMEKALTEAQEKLDEEKKAVLSIQTEYNNCQGMYNQAMEAIKKLEDTQSLLQKQLEGSKIKSDEMTKNYEESQNIIQQKANEKQILAQQNEIYMAAKDEELRKMKDEFVDTIENLKSQYVEVKVYNDFLRKEIRKLKGIPENILIEEVNTEEIDANKDLYKQIESQRIQIENLKEQLELSLKL